MMPHSPSRLFLAAYLSLVAVVGCGARVTVATTDATGTGGVPGTSGGGASGAGTHGGGASDGGGADGGSGMNCHQCACEKSFSMGGCDNFCVTPVNGSESLHFCDGVSADVECAACLMMNCPSADPNDPSACM